MHQVPANFFIADIEAIFKKERAQERGEVIALSFVVNGHRSYPLPF